MATITRIIRKRDKQQRPTQSRYELLQQMSDEDLMARSMLSTSSSTVSPSA